MTTYIQPTRIEQYIGERLSWAHGHQGKPIAAFVVAILEKQTGSQAELAREFTGAGRRSFGEFLVAMVISGRSW